MKYFLVLRGSPGSGKSTYAKKVLDRFCIMFGLSGCICSADYYFERKDGFYDWNPKLLNRAHQWCYEQVEKNMQPELDDNWNGDCDLIILDNTNIQKWNYRKYIELANKYGYKVKETIVGSLDVTMAEEYARRNVHGVSYKKVVKMMERFEK